MHGGIMRSGRSGAAWSLSIRAALARSEHTELLVAESQKNEPPHKGGF